MLQLILQLVLGIWSIFSVDKWNPYSPPRINLKSVSTFRATVHCKNSTSPYVPSCVLINHNQHNHRKLGQISSTFEWYPARQSMFSAQREEQKYWRKSLVDSDKYDFWSTCRNEQSHCGAPREGLTRHWWLLSARLAAPGVVCILERAPAHFHKYVNRTWLPPSTVCSHTDGLRQVTVEYKCRLHSHNSEWPQRQCLNQCFPTTGTGTKGVFLMINYVILIM